MANLHITNTAYANSGLEETISSAISPIIYYVIIYS